MKWLQLKNLNVQDTRVVHVPLTMTEESKSTICLQQIRHIAAKMIGEEEEVCCQLMYVNSDGDHMIVSSDTDLEKLQEYMDEAGLESIVMIVTGRNVSEDQERVQGDQDSIMKLATVMSKLTTNTNENVTSEPTPMLLDAMQVIFSSINKLTGAAETSELVAMANATNTILFDQSSRAVLDELSHDELFNEYLHNLLAAVRNQDENLPEEMKVMYLRKLLLRIHHLYRLAARKFGRSQPRFRCKGGKFGKFGKHGRHHRHHHYKNGRFHSHHHHSHHGHRGYHHRGFDHHHFHHGLGHHDIRKRHKLGKHLEKLRGFGKDHFYPIMFLAEMKEGKHRRGRGAVVTADVTNMKNDIMLVKNQ